MAIEKLLPPIAEIRAYREKYGCGLVEAKRELALKRILDALGALDCKTEVETTLRDVLTVLIDKRLL